MPACTSDGEARASSTGGALRRLGDGRGTRHLALQESGAQRRWSSMTCWPCHQTAGAGTASCYAKIRGGAYRAPARGAGGGGWRSQAAFPSRPGSAPTTSAGAGLETRGSEATWSSAGAGGRGRWGTLLLDGKYAVALPGSFTLPLAPKPLAGFLGLQGLRRWFGVVLAGLMLVVRLCRWSVDVGGWLARRSSGLRQVGVQG